MECSCCSTNNAGDFFEVSLSHKGKSYIIKVSTATTGLDLHLKTLYGIFGVIPSSNGYNDESIIGSSTELIKLLFKGKRIMAQPDTFPFEGLPNGIMKKKPLKIIVMATNTSAIQELSAKRSDPLIRGFDQAKSAMEKRAAAASYKYWADDMVQHKDYKFCRIKACEDQSFGLRANESTPHAFRAKELLEKLATDPGIVAIMKERELVVGTLGEMDPIDDRIMQKTEHSGGCLLGYNTNHGLRIDIKLRTDDLSGFRPYEQLVSTLIHELSHNWVGEHDLLFWTNYAQMRAEYIYTHTRLLKSAILVRGKKTAELAGLDEGSLHNVLEFIMNELVGEMGPHGLHPDMIVDPIRNRIQELEDETLTMRDQYSYRLGGDTSKQTAKNVSSIAGHDTSDLSSPRELALAAAERRAREQKEKKMKNSKS